MTLETKNIYGLNFPGIDPTGGRFFHVVTIPDRRFEAWSDHDAKSVVYFLSVEFASKDIKDCFPNMEERIEVLNKIMTVARDTSLFNDVAYYEHPQNLKLNPSQIKAWFCLKIIDECVPDLLYSNPIDKEKIRLKNIQDLFLKSYSSNELFSNLKWKKTEIDVKD